MKTSSAKAKGRRLQQRIALKVLELFPELEPDDVKSTPMGVGGADVQLSPAARKVHNVDYECKSHKSFAIYSIMDQAESNAKGTPVVVIKANRREPLVVLKEEDYFDLLRQVKESK